MKWHLKQHTPLSLGLWQEVADRNCFHRQGNLLRLHNSHGGSTLSAVFRVLQLGWLVQRMVIKRSLQGKEMLQEKQSL